MVTWETVTWPYDVVVCLLSTEAKYLGNCGRWWVLSYWEPACRKMPNRSRMVTFSSDDVTRPDVAIVVTSRVLIGIRQCFNTVVFLYVVCLYRVHVDSWSRPYDIIDEWWCHEVITSEAEYLEKKRDTGFIFWGLIGNRLCWVEWSRDRWCHATARRQWWRVDVKILKIIHSLKVNYKFRSAIWNYAWKNC